MIAFSTSSISFRIVALAVVAAVVQSNPLSDRAVEPGTAGISIAPKIVGGSASTVGDFPYFVEMGGCGGALIGPDLVLFAAHCGDWHNRQVNVGAYEKRIDSYGSQPRFCEKWESHPNYGQGGSGINNDFALCKLNEPVYIDDDFVRLELNRDLVPLNGGEELIVMGLGALAQNGVGPQFLHNVTVPVISNTDCNAPASYNGGVTSAMLCAGYPEGEKDSCQGDSGGPLVKRVYQNNGKFIDYHVGIVSWGQGCALPNKPGVYGRTSSAIDFIENTGCKDFKSTASFCNNQKIQAEKCEVALDIEITTDIYGSETGWNLVDRDSRELIKKRRYLLNFHDNKHAVCIQNKRCYKFEITDTYGDGMCTTQAGCGAYQLSLGGETFFQGNGQFSTSVTKEFCVSKNGKVVENLPPTPAPVSPPTQAPPPTGKCGGDRNKQFEMEIKIDDYGGETKWIMSEIDPNTFDMNNAKPGKVFDSRTDPAEFEAFVRYRYPDHAYYCLKLNACYLFEIFDDFGDGLVGGGTHGFYKGSLNGKDVFSGADFGAYEWKAFCTGSKALPTKVPTARPTNPPTLSPTKPSISCNNQDVQIGKKKKNCSWAGRGSLKKRKRKCKRKYGTQKVYDVCPQTCGEKAGLGVCKHLYQQK